MAESPISTLKATLDKGPERSWRVVKDAELRALIGIAEASYALRQERSRDVHLDLEWALEMNLDAVLRVMFGEEVALDGF